MSQSQNRKPHGARAVALVGPYGSGKTSLLESIAGLTGAIARKGRVADGTSLGDAGAQARARRMSVEVNVLTTTYLGEDFVFLDCPGSIEFLGDTLNVLPGVDAAVVVVEPAPEKAGMLKPYLKYLSDAKVPHLLFVNKFDRAGGGLRALLAALRESSDIPLMPRQIPIWEKGAATGFVDLALERAFAYRQAGAEVIEISDKRREKDARFEMLERLADNDDHLMEELLGDVEPEREEVFGDLTRGFADGLVVPVLIGAAEHDHGVGRLLKALRHEAPDISRVRARLDVAPDAAAVLVLKTFHATQGGKLSLVRVLSGTLKDNQSLYGPQGEARVGGIFALSGGQQVKKAEASAGDTVALARLEVARTGDILGTVKTAARRMAAPPLIPVHRLCVEAADRKDEVKLTAALTKLMEEDPSLAFEHDQAMQEMVLAGQGEMHLKVAMDNLAGKFGLALTSRLPHVPYRETIRKSTQMRGRHKRQTGGHGQFGDVVLEISPAPRGAGFSFEDRIKGGVVPKQWIGSVQKGVQDAMKAGPLGFPVVDVAVALVDGSYHTVDSSDAAFQTAGRLAMSEGLAASAPVLLEPMVRLSIHVPNDATAKVGGLIGARRGTPLGFDARPGWRGWDTVSALLPLAEVHGLIVDLRSLTQGVGSFDMRFDHLAELNGKLADQVVAA